MAADGVFMQDRLDFVDCAVDRTSAAALARSPFASKKS
jgi:hypothetical protein